MSRDGVLFWFIASSGNSWQLIHLCPIRWVQGDHLPAAGVGARSPHEVPPSGDKHLSRDVKMHASCFYSTVNRYWVVEVITSPARRVVVGKLSWLGLSG